ncbi:hypothetical protein ETD86_45130 [Nonomuraea turkmeniaca]|uniref:LysR substrate-binding domain-containing protein n=1 Tax=Nonomuraea turkmeniaca TaxID=103838 RepID=A0A5S4EZ98_9ACTN|nr:MULTISPECIES: hypothetical protein [Nonomuraea]TMR09073.1 hypothetical protein ETD86_45130 [Nonomuraea turkmeniaca]
MQVHPRALAKSAVGCEPRPRGQISFHQNGPPEGGTALPEVTDDGGAAPDYWRHTFIPTHTPSGRPITIGPKVASFDQKIPLLLTGEAIAPVTAQARRLAPHPGIAYPLIRDAPLARFALVWRTAAETDLIRTFASVVTELGPIVL